MAYNLVITNKANSELDNILQYITVRLSNPIAAHNLLEQIELCYERLTENPHIYPLCKNLKGNTYRKVVIKNYVLIYRIDENTSTIFILHIFFGRQNYTELI